MSRPTLTVVIPAYNSREHIAATLDALVESATRGPFETDVVLVDDGSTDGTAEAVVAACASRLPLRIVSQTNRGRFEARRTGLEAATGEWILLLDSRVTLEEDALAFVATRLESGECVWNGHVHVRAGGNPYGTFWKLLAELAWPAYFDEPRTTSYGPEDFDRFPKGTTCFLARRETLLSAVAEFRSGYSDSRRANDDTPLIRSIAMHERIHLSPRFACTYEPRGSGTAFIHHAVHRGIVFLDGHGRRESRYFPAVIAFYPVSTVLAVVALRRPAIAIQVGAAIASAAALLGVVKRREPYEVVTLALLTPVYAAGHGIGMWCGLSLLAKNRLTDEPPA